MSMLNATKHVSRPYAQISEICAIFMLLILPTAGRHSKFLAKVFPRILTAQSVLRIFVRSISPLLAVAAVVNTAAHLSMSMLKGSQQKVMVQRLVAHFSFRSFPFGLTAFIKHM